MSSPSPLTAAETLDLLLRLQQAIAAIAREEERSLSELAKRRVSLARKYRDALARNAMAMEAHSEGEEAQGEEREAALRAHFAARRNGIQRSYRASMQALQAQAERKKDQYLGDLQMRHFRAERGQPEEMRRLEQEHAANIGELQGTVQHLQELEQRTDRALGGLPTLRRQIWQVDHADVPAPSDEAGAEVGEAMASAESHVEALESQSLPRLLRALPLPLILPLIAALLFGTAFLAGGAPPLLAAAGAIFLILGIGAFGLYRSALASGRQFAGEAVAALRLVRRGLDQAESGAQAAHAAAVEKLEQHYATEFAEIDHAWAQADEVAKRFALKKRQKLETQVLRLMGRHDRGLEPRLQASRATRAAVRESALAQKTAERAELEKSQEHELGALTEEEEVRWAPLITRWEAEVLPLYHQALEAAESPTAPLFPREVEALESWCPPAEFTSNIPVGRLALDLARDPKAYPRDARLALPGPAQLALPLSLIFPQQGSLLFETADSGEPTVIATLNNVILRMFASVPPGKLVVTIIDPVGLGQNFAGLMTLGDYEESLINRRIWTQREQIEERLSELNEHIEKMIQMYLRDEFATISQYNVKAGSVAEKYHLLVLADFPVGFSETAAKRLQSIAASGPRCGVFTLLHWDTRHPQPDGFVPAELRKRSVCLKRVGAGYGIDPAQNSAGAQLELDAAPEPATAAALIHRIGKSSVDSNRVEVPFAQIAPAPGELWQSETTQELRVPIGRTGATKLQYLAIGKGTRQHALFAGKTGSGKSTLFHVIITNLALWCSPEQVEFYLIDFKKGVEFKCYASQRLPHARVVAIESDREFALSVLQRVDEELRRRGDLFRALGVQDVAGYKRASGQEPMPRTLLIIDEFQEFFVEDDPTAQSAALLFDRIVRQGRAFGIHVLLGSQTLGGAYTLARATLGQMAIRVALQCNEADAYLIMDDNNAAPRLLSRPGEGIYNDAAGAVEGNSPFQVVWLSDEERDRKLEEIHALAASRHLPERTPVVFEGNAPADVDENDPLRAVLAQLPAAVPTIGRAWLGAPNAIKGPTEVRFKRQSGHHLLIVGQREETAATMQALSLIALAAQYPPGAARFFFFTSAAAGSAEEAFIERAVARAEASGHPVALVRGGDVGAAMGELASELKGRLAAGENAEAPVIFLFVQGLQRFKKLRHEEDFSFSSSAEDTGNPGAQFNEIVTDGSAHGVHLVVSVDTLSNVQRWLPRKALGEFELRVLFQMSANDSATLIDSTQASNLGLHRALLYNEQEGTLETFRPYATPSPAWLAPSTPAPEREGFR